MFARAKLGAVVGLCAVSTVLLAACGGATSDGGSSESSAVAPLSKSARATESSISSSGDSSSTKSSGESKTQTPQDREAREVSEVPSSGQQLSERDQNYLKELKDNSINVDGAEGSLIGTASGVCQSQDTKNIDVMTLAVAGQLVEQGRTQQKPEEVAAVLARAAKSAYC